MSGELRDNEKTLGDEPFPKAPPHRKSRILATVLGTLSAIMAIGAAFGAFCHFFIPAPHASIAKGALAVMFAIAWTSAAVRCFTPPKDSTDESTSR